LVKNIKSYKEGFMRGLSLSGGGIKATAHIGALKAFE